jgi:hypothetical protein
MDVNYYFTKIDNELTTAYLDGKDAFYQDKLRNDNPYENGSMEYGYWDGGYMESKHEVSE